VWLLYTGLTVNLHYKCEVAKLGTTATGKFLSGKKERAPVQCCQIEQDFRVAKEALKFKCGGAGGVGIGGGGADTCKGWVERERETLRERKRKSCTHARHG
jgi:hypothetical protein